MKTYKASFGKVCQNAYGHSIAYKGIEVKPFDLYGTFDGVSFVSAPFATKETAFMPMMIKTSTGWISAHPCKIVEFVKEAWKNDFVILYDWNAYKNIQKANHDKMKRYLAGRHKNAIMRECAANTEGSLRYHKGKKRLDDRYNEVGKPTQKRRSQRVVFGSGEYVTVSGWLYGKTISMNNHNFTMNEKISYYMDGTGCRANTFDNRDMRPLNDVFPVKSGKKAG